MTYLIGRLIAGIIAAIVLDVSFARFAIASLVLYAAGYFDGRNDAEQPE